MQSNYPIELFMTIQDLVNKFGHRAYVSISKTIAFEDLRKQIILETDFLPENTRWKERCAYILEGIKEQKICKCGCGTPISIFNEFVLSHSRRSQEAKDSWKKNMKKTMIERYGEDYGKKILASAKETNLKKYGVSYTCLLEEVKQKMKETTLKNHGVDNCSKSEAIKQKKKDTYEKHYGTKFNCSPEINKRIKKSNNKNTYERFSRFADKMLPLFTVEEFEGGGYDKDYKWLCKTCNSEFLHYYHNGKMPRCPTCFPKDISTGHQEILDFVSSVYSGKIRNNDRTCIYPHEIDIYLPELNLGIEFNGLYWHSEDKGKGKNYHLNKSELCKEKGTRLIQIFEDEWVFKKEIVKSKIANLLTITPERIFARNCTIEEIPSKMKSEFLISNHIQGDDKSLIRLGLFYKKVLVAVMTFGKPRFNKNFQYELIRYCTLLNHSVIGGASKLLNYFLKTYNPESIISYADKRWTTSKENLYFKLGFSYSHSSDPNYFYTKNRIRESRIKYQKHKLKTLLPEFDETLSESKNMEKAGFYKIWDCGNYVYTLNPP